MSIRYYPENKSPNIEQNLDEEGKFVDIDFPNNDDSLFNKKKGVKDEDFEKEIRKKLEKKDDSKFKWIRLFSSNEYIFDNKLSKSELIEKEKNKNIIQGSIGNCYFISYLHKLKCEKPDIFTSIIRDVKPKKGYIEVNFFIKENNRIEEVVVYVDDYVPYKDFSLYRPLFSHYKSFEDKKFVVGIYLLVEKAYAKFCGSYRNIKGSNQKKDYMLNLTGSKTQYKYLYEFYKNLPLNNLSKVDKNKIFTEIHEFSKENMILVSTKKEYEEGEYTKFGVCGNHQYDYIKGKTLSSIDNKSEDFFFHLWNPHGRNINPESMDFFFIINNSYLSNLWNWFWGKNEPGYYKYEGFDDINKLNKIGFDTGDIYLNLERFLYAFNRFSFQNRKKVSENYKKYHKNNDLLKLFPLFYYIFGRSIFYQKSDYFIAKIIKELYKNEDKKSEKIIKKIVEEEKDDNEMNSDLFQKSENNETKEKLKKTNEEIKNEILKSLKR